MLIEKNYNSSLESIKVLEANNEYECPSLYEFREGNSFQYEYLTSDLKWIKLKHYGFKNGDPNGIYINNIQRDLENNRIRVKKRHFVVDNKFYAPTEASELFYTLNPSHEKIYYKSINYCVTSDKTFGEWKPTGIYFLNEDTHKIQYPSPEKTHICLYPSNREFDEYKFWVSHMQPNSYEQWGMQTFLETDHLFKIRMYHKYGELAIICSEDKTGYITPLEEQKRNKKMKVSTYDLSELSKKKYILSFCIEGLFIELLPPFIGNGYYTYESSIYINGIEQRSLEFNTVEYKNWFGDNKNCSEKMKKFKECWRELLYLNRNIKLPKPKEDVLWKYLVEIRYWNKYILKHKVLYTTPDGNQKSDEIWEINKNRAILNVINKTIPIITDEGLKGVKIHKVISLAS